MAYFIFFDNMAKYDLTFSPSTFVKVQQNQGFPGEGFPGEKTTENIPTCNNVIQIDEQ